MSVELIDIERFVPDILTELPDCPVPAIERRIRDAVIEACERAPLWEAQLPEIPVAIGQTCFDLPAPPGQSKVHDIVRLTLDNCFLRNVPLEETRDNVYATIPYRGQAFHVLKRGQVGLNIPPTKASDPFSGSASGQTICLEVDFETVCGPPPVDPGPVVPAINSEFDTDPADIYNQNVNHPTFSLGNTRAFHGGGATGSNATVIQEDQRNETSGVFYWETVLDSYTNPSSNNRMVAGITQEVPLIDTAGIAGTSQSIGVAANNGGSAIRDVYQVGVSIYTRTGSEIIENSVVRHLLDLDAGTYSVAVDGEAFEEVISGLDTTNPWFPFTEQGRSGAGLIGGAWILRTVNDQFEYDIPAGADVFGTNGVSQNTVDAYVLALAEYNQCVSDVNNNVAPVDPGPVDPGVQETLDPTALSGAGTPAFSNGNRTFSNSSGGAYATVTTINAIANDPNTIVAWETAWDSIGGGSSGSVGISSISPAADWLGIASTGWAYWEGGNIYNNGGAVSSTPPLSVNGDVVSHRIEWDGASLGTYIINVNGGADIVVVAGITGDWYPAVTSLNSTTVTFVFETSDFAEELPAGAVGMGIPAVTQEEVDQYNAALDVFNQFSSFSQGVCLLPADAGYAQQQADIAAQLASQNADRNCFGIEIAVTLKPTREADRIPYCFYRDYYQLVIDGALGYAFNMHGSPWFDRMQADKRRQAFEYELAKAKQAMDRGFSDRPLQARPRTF